MSDEHGSLVRHLNVGRCELDRTRGLLLAEGEPLNIRARTFALLLFLVENSGRVVSRDQIFDAVWKGVVVGDDTLTQTVHDLRQALGDAEHTLVRTIPKRGYLLALPSAIIVERGVSRVLAGPYKDEQPVVAVMSFDNSSSDPEQIFFVDGLADDLITDLSKVGGLTVIARNSSFAYRGQHVSIQEVGRELGARYIVEGSVRRIGHRVRINAQVSDADAGNQIWADRFDSELADVFGLQDDIVRRLVVALSSVLPIGTPVVRRRAKTLAAFELCTLGRTVVSRSADDNRVAREALQRAVEIEPDYSDAHAWLSFAHHYAWLYAGQPELPHRGLSLEAAKHAIALDPGNPDGHWSLGLVHTFERRLEESISAFDQALTLNPNLADGWATYADPLVYSGRCEEAVASVRKAFVLNPIPPERYYWFLGFAQFAARQYEEAIVSLRHVPLQRTQAMRILAAALAMIGLQAEAAQVAQTFLTMNPRFRVGEFLAGQPFASQSERAHFEEGYLRAGLPA